MSTGDVIVQNGATNMVGQCVIQIAKSCGIPNINIIRDMCSLEGFLLVLLLASMYFFGGLFGHYNIFFSFFKNIM